MTGKHCIDYLYGVLTDGSSAPIEESRKWGIYNTTNLLFKTYFKVGLPFLTEFALTHPE